MSYSPSKRTMLRREVIRRARQRIVAMARLRGGITFKEACRIGRFGQAWYHLAILAKAGLLKHAGHNRWVPPKSRTSAWARHRSREY